MVPDAELRVRHGESHLGALGAAEEIYETLLAFVDTTTRTPNPPSPNVRDLGVSGTPFSRRFGLVRTSGRSEGTSGPDRDALRCCEAAHVDPTKGVAMTVTEFLEYLSEHPATKQLAEMLAVLSVRRGLVPIPTAAKETGQRIAS